MFKNKEVDAGFVCSGPYVEGAKKFGLELLVVPKVYGKTTYNSYILVHKKSSINTLEDLRGKTFAFTDPLSNTGKEVPTYMLAKMGETPKSFFKEYIYTHGHDKSIWAVVENVVDAAAVDSLIWEYMNIKEPQYTSETKIIIKSKPYEIPPFVVRKGLDKKIKDDIKKVLLSMHKDKRGKKILDKMMIECFVEVEDKNYDNSGKYTFMHSPLKRMSALPKGRYIAIAVNYSDLLQRNVSAASGNSFNICTITKPALIDPFRDQLLKDQVNINRNIVFPEGEVFCGKFFGLPSQTLNLLISGFVSQTELFQAQMYLVPEDTIVNQLLSQESLVNVQEILQPYSLLWNVEKPVI
jgi:hypothetical protein